MHPFERHMLTRYAAALVGDGGQVWARRWRTTELRYWMRTYHALLGLPQLPAAAKDPDTPHEIEARDALSHHFARLRTGKTPSPSALERKLSWLGDAVGLGPLDRAIMGLLARSSTSVEFRGLSLALSSNFLPELTLTLRHTSVHLSEISVLLGLSASTLAGRLTPRRPLMMFGFVDDRRDGDYAASAPVLKIARAARSTPDTLRNLLFGVPKASALTWEDFSYLRKDADVVAAILQAAIQAKARGIGILLHGAPGTGKTAFASALAKRLDLHAVFVGESDDDGEEPDRTQRIGAFALAQKLAMRADRLLLVVDEAEDIFVGVDDGHGANRRGAKVFMNNLVEGNPSPTIFISNHPGRLGPAILRRMTFALEFPSLDRVTRERLVCRAAARHKLTLDDHQVRALSRLDAPPALIDHGLRAARLCDRRPEIALCATTSVMKVMDLRTVELEPSGTPFDAAFARADADLERLTQQIITSGRTDISLCLSGLPGTGKSAYARHLAGRMGLEVVERRASDLLGAFVGESEQNIAACFREAEAKRAFLIFDEADSLLRDRMSARQSYERRQVNEMLTWMERHPYPFACTTNFAEGLDPAAARRFLFKVQFLPLARHQARALFRHAFGVEPSAELDTLDLLTPGDFAVVARRAEVLGDKAAGALVQALAAEVASKPQATHRPIGFTPFTSERTE